MSGWTTLQDDRIGLLSDTHGVVDRTELAIECLLKAGATTILHLGDLGSEQVIDQLVGLPVRLVFGNVDQDRAFSTYASRLDLVVDHPTMRLCVGGRRIIATHGHLETEMAQAVEARPDFIIHGHSHLIRDETIDGIRFLNPGAVHRAAVWSVATLEPATGRFSVIQLPR
jgi:putative phosphoesterase